MSPNAWKQFHSGHDQRTDMAFNFPSVFTDGGVADGLLGLPGYFGWMGMGGSVFQWSPEQELSFAYVPLDLIPADPMNARGAALMYTVN